MAGGARDMWNQGLTDRATLLIDRMLEDPPAITETRDVLPGGIQRGRSSYLEELTKVADSLCGSLPIPFVPNQVSTCSGIRSRLEGRCRQEERRGHLTSAGYSGTGPFPVPDVTFRVVNQKAISIPSLQCGQLQNAGGAESKDQSDHLMDESRQARSSMSSGDLSRMQEVILL
ncbi:hypothetical protein CB1_002180001 [Camelus ferus]|nr:hypothetical protein CB1_002180001 [Camelus ferus]